ncbi:MAG: hypothetical protein IT354_12845, partial [Gemmatimonadaceae bacterium]|nr:hypothetical protein [Gemmatimonadaceae bacterium]
MARFPWRSRAVAVALLAGVLCASTGSAQRTGASKKAVASTYDPIFRKYSKRYFSVA